MKGGGFFRRVFTGAMAFAGIGGLKPQTIATSYSQVQAQTPPAPTKTPTSPLTARQMQDRVIRRSNAWRGYVRSSVIPPFKFCHGRTMVARYPRMPGS